jgi:hypothetical protein
MTTIVEAQEVRKACSKCAAEHPWDIVPLGNIDWEQKPLQDWQVDCVEPLLRSLGSVTF